MAPPYDTEMTKLIKRFRNRIMDNDAVLNVLKGDIEFSDEQIEGYIIEALYDINEAEPRRRTFTLQKFPKTSLLLDGAMVFMLQGRGLLHLRNQVSYNDAGFSVNLDDKSGFYAQWLGQVQAVYLRNLKEFKRSLIPRFRGVDSPAGRWY